MSICEWWNSYIPHHVSNDKILHFLDFNTKAKISKKNVKAHYYHNLLMLRAGTYLEKQQASLPYSFFRSNVPIENQQEWKSVVLGKVSMDYAGCEIIATYNARLALGEHMAENEMAELISMYERGGVVFLGRWGVAPMAIYRYFQSEGYNVGMTTSIEKAEINAIGENYDTAIISFFNDQKRVTGGIHTVNVSKEQNGYVCHNDYYKESGVYVQKKPQENLWKVVMGLSKGKAKPICIIGINKKE